MHLTYERLNTPLDWKSREGHTLHKVFLERGSMRATVYDQASAQLVYDLPVYIFPGCSLAKIATYPKKKLAQHLYINLSSKQSQGAVIVSLGGLGKGGKQGKEPKQEAIAIRSTLGQLDRVPVDVLKIIFTYVGSKGMNQVRQLSKAFYKRTTGYNRPELGVTYKPEASRLTAALSLPTRVWDFKSPGGKLTPDSIPSFPFYRLIGKVQHIPPSFWPYLRGTQVHTLDLYGNEIGNAGAVELAKNLLGTHVQTLDLYDNQIGAAGAIELAKHLLGTHVETLNLGSNSIGAAGAIELAKHLLGTHVQTLNLGGNQIGAAGTIELAKHLKDTHVHTLNLRHNQIGDAGAIELAKHLKGSQVHTLHLYGNQIGAETEQTLKEQYPHIRWRF